MTNGLLVDEAIQEAKKLKPSKSQPTIIQRAEEALSRAGLHEGRRENQVPQSMILLVSSGRVMKTSYCGN